MNVSVIDIKPDIMLLHPSRWLMCYHKHLSNPQLGCKELRRHENANNKRTHENEEAAEETEKEEEAGEKPREKLRKL